MVDFIVIEHECDPPIPEPKEATLAQHFYVKLLTVIGTVISARNPELKDRIFVLNDLFAEDDPKEGGDRDEGAEEVARNTSDLNTEG